jgi:D-beta-D-heptose 7-phosphate kinase/D-beta-D-heptose 1-phosphate adenosyltransferase
MKKVLVIGDSCIDIFHYGKCKRICPEAPVPVFLPTRVKQSMGMAMNVKENLKALGVWCDICTNIPSEFNVPTKKRLIDEVSNQMLLRIDENDVVQPIEMEFLRNINLKQYDAIVISDYGKGFLTEEHINYIANHHPLTFMDTKKRIGGWAKDIKYIKINEKEYNENVSFFVPEYPNNIIVTLGQEGAMLVYDVEGVIQTKKFPIEEEHEVRDLSGAGDTFLAAIVAKFMENNDICEAIQFANKCAAWVVTQKGVVVVDLNKVKL